jgi:GxxExxY protein
MAVSRLYAMPRRRLIHEELTESVIGSFYEVYNVLGFGFLEHIYVPALEHELRARGHQIAREVWVTVFFKGMVMGKQRLDMVVDEKLVVEVNPHTIFGQARFASFITTYAQHTYRSASSSTLALSQSSTAWFRPARRHDPFDPLFPLNPCHYLSGCRPVTLLLSPLG